MNFMNPAKIRTVANRSKFGNTNPVFNNDRVESLKKQIDDGLTGRMDGKWDNILALDNSYQPIGPLDPFFVPDDSTQGSVLAVVRADAAMAVDLGIRWKVNGNYEDAKAVERILYAWTQIDELSTGTSVSRLTWSYSWPMFIQATQLISDSPVFSSSLRNSVEDMTVRGLAMNTMDIQTENRAAWGTMLGVTAGAFLNDRELFDRSIQRWMRIVDICVKGNIPVSELDRGADSLHYSNFLLNALVQTAEIARFNGEWLYDYVATDGSTLKGLWDNVSHWTAVPEDFTYWPGSSTIRIQAHVDPLHALWPNEDSQYLIDTFTTTLDYYGYRQGMLAYRNNPLYG